MKVCVVGLGYIGFPTACLLARAGHEVLGVDTDSALVDRLRKGQVHIVNEPHLLEVAESVLSSGALRVSGTPEESDAFLICVPTPVDATGCQDGGLEAAAAVEPGALGASGSRSQLDAFPVADMRFVRAAVRSIGPYVRPGNLVVLESTVPPGTTLHVVLPTLAEHGLGSDEVLVAHAPERVLPGSIVAEMVANERIVGGVTARATEAARTLYASFVTGTILTTDATTAEFTKLVENAYRDVNIAFANELARVSRHIGVDVGEVIALANHHPRVNILQPGPGVGGHCIAVDPYFIIQEARTLTPLLQAARSVNRDMPQEVVRAVADLASPGAFVALLGAAYKGNVGDDRESPSLEVARLLRQMGYQLTLHDPYVKRYSVALGDVLRDADLIVVLTDHDVYRELPPSVAATRVRHRVILDTRRIIDSVEWEAAGFEVRWLGDGRARVTRSREKSKIGTWRKG